MGAYRGLTGGVRARERAKTGVKTGVTRAIGQKPLGWAEFWYKQVLSGVHVQHLMYNPNVPMQDPPYYSRVTNSY